MSSRHAWLWLGVLVIALGAIGLEGCGRKKVKRKRPKPPEIASVSPVQGSELGGTAITITGARFEDDAEVEIGGRPALSVMVASEETLTAVTPPGAVGTADVRVSNPGIRTTTMAEDAFTYLVDAGGYPVPTVTGISPAEGPPSGGTDVIVSGTNFVPGALLFIGGRPATLVVVTSSSFLSGVTPPGAPGPATVTVINPDLKSAVLPDGFLYTFSAGGLSLAGITPDTGSTDGGTLVSITGDGFEPGATATLGGAGLTIVGFVSSREMTGLTPPGAAGPADLVVTNPGGGNVTRVDAYTYVVAPLPTVSGISPDWGETAGGTDVTVTGTEFLPGSTASLDGVPLQSQTIVDVNTITGKTPPRAQAGSVDVTITNPNGSAKLVDGFTYIPATGGAPFIIDITPDSGPIGTEVVIDGVNFAPTPEGNRVRLDGEMAPVRTASETQLVVYVPPRGRTGDFTVEVAGLVSNGVRFTVTSPGITSIVPNSGFVLDPVTLLGENFSSVIGENEVWFNGSAASVTGASPTMIQAIVPDEAIAGEVWVVVNGVPSNRVFFCVETPDPPWPQLRGMTPDTGPVGTTVTLQGEWFSPTPENNKVWFNGIRAPVLSVDATAYPPDVTITTQVPVGATTGDVWVEVGGFYTVIARTFTVTTPPPPPPVITRLSPDTAEQDSGLIIEGMNFRPETYNNIVTVNGAWADVVRASDTLLLVRVPFTSSGLVVVEVAGQASTGVPFTIIPPPTGPQTVEFFGRQVPAPGDRVVFVVDGSDSMLELYGDFVDREGNLIVGGTKWDILKDRMIQSITELPPDFHFNIYPYNGTDVSGICVPVTGPWQVMSVPATQANKAAAVAFLEAYLPVGQTGTAGAVRVALQSDPLNRTLILCTDGLWNCPAVSGSEQLCEMFNANTAGAAIHSFGIRVDGPFARVLQEIAKLTYGTFTLIE